MQRPLNRDDIRHAIDLSSFNRGLAYFQQGRVIDLRDERSAEGVRLQARVRGSGSRVYVLSIWIPADPERNAIAGGCACPVGYNCKHVAAACLAFEERERELQGSDPGAADAFVRRWLQRVVQAGSPQGPDADGDRLIYVLLPDPKDEWGASVQLRVAKPLKRGRGLSKGRVVSLYNLFYGYSRPAYLSPKDHEVLGMVNATARTQWTDTSELAGATGSLAVRRMIETGRC